MPRSFDITTASGSIRLDNSGQGVASFTVSNALSAPVLGRAVLEPEGKTPPEWLSLAGEAERDFTVDGTHIYKVKVSVPPDAAEGTHGFHLLMVDVASPDERYATSPSVVFQVSRPVPSPKKPFPWWIPAAAGAGLALLVMLVVLWPPRPPPPLEPGGPEPDAETPTPGNEGTGGSGAENSTCVCTGPACGSNAIGGDQGDIFTNVAPDQVQALFQTHPNTGWTCFVPAKVRGSGGPLGCYCQESCGSGGVGADSNYVDLALSLETVSTEYGGGKPGNRTGWLCGNYRGDLMK